MISYSNKNHKWSLNNIKTNLIKYTDPAFSIVSLGLVFGGWPSVANTNDFRQKNSVDKRYTSVWRISGPGLFTETTSQYYH